MGVWIETPPDGGEEDEARVTPFVGVWIETSILHDPPLESEVTPFVGVWIETEAHKEDHRRMKRHTLRGCVD